MLQKLTAKPFFFSAFLVRSMIKDSNLMLGDNRIQTEMILISLEVFFIYIYIYIFLIQAKFPGCHYIPGALRKLSQSNIIADQDMLKATGTVSCVLISYWVCFLSN